MEETCDLFFQVAGTCSFILLAFVEKALIPMVKHTEYLSLPSFTSIFKLKLSYSNKDYKH
jgi:hypothetical protein